MRTQYKKFRILSKTKINLNWRFDSINLNSKSLSDKDQIIPIYSIRC